MKAKVLTLILSAILFITMSVPVYADGIETADATAALVYADGTETADESLAPVYTDDTETADAPDIVVENTSGEFADDAISSIADPPSILKQTLSKSLLMRL